MMNERDALLLLSQLDGFGVRKFRLMVDQGVSIAEWANDLRPISNAEERLLVSESDIRLLEQLKSESKHQKIQDECLKAGVQMVTFIDPEYPELLQQIYDAPLILYVKGNLIPEDRASVAIVGSRHASPYGIRISHRFGYELAEAGVTVVSGLARGVDGEAHRGALKARGRTIAVLGSGVDVIYPKEHEKLAEEIAESGAVISELPLGAPPIASHFPSRNRIIAGLSLGVLVVEAHSRSGSLITASSAAQEGREVYAVPGAVDSIQSRGTNTLIQEGAKLAQHSGDILEDLKEVLSDHLKIESAKTGENSQPSEKEGEDDRLSELFNAGEASLFDEIRLRCGLNAGELGQLLIQLELKEKIRRKPGGFYEPVFSNGSTFRQESQRNAKP